MKQLVVAVCLVFFASNLKSMKIGQFVKVKKRGETLFEIIDIFPMCRYVTIEQTKITKRGYVVGCAELLPYDDVIEIKENGNSNK